MTVGECLTNLIWVKVSKFKDIKLSGNWMWPSKYGEEGYFLSLAVEELTKILKILKFEMKNLNFFMMLTKKK